MQGVTQRKMTVVMQPRYTIISQTQDKQVFQGKQVFKTDCSTQLKPASIQHLKIFETGANSANRLISVHRMQFIFFAFSLKSSETP